MLDYIIQLWYTLGLTQQDLVNGSFEFFGAGAAYLNVRRLNRDKVVLGFNPISTMFYTSWGFWNIYYYSHLSQPISWIGGIAIVSVNSWWLILIAYYKFWHINLDGKPDEY